MEYITGAMDIPYLGFRLYKKIHDQICNAWKAVAWDSMRQADEEESKIS